MKISFGLALLATSASGFSLTTFGVHRSTQLLARVDSSEAIQEALEATKKYGASSPEARVAWDAVEEMDGADNSAAMQPSLDDSCEVEEVSQDCLDYSANLDELQTLLEEIKPQDVKPNFASQLKDVKLHAETGVQAESSAELLEVIKAAQSASEKYGRDSVEARVAWSEVEDVAAAGTKNNALGGAADSENCEVEVVTPACEALDELDRVLNSDEFSA